jgi:hypothetical protein
MFDMRCEENGIERRLTRIIRPGANSRVERMNRTIKDAAGSAILRQSQATPPVSRWLNRNPRLRPQAEDSQGHRPHLQMLDYAIPQTQLKSDPSHPGLKTYQQAEEFDDPGLIWYEAFRRSQHLPKALTKLA